MKSNQLAGIGILLGLAGAVLLALFVATTGDDELGGETAEVIVTDDGIPAGTLGDQVAGLVTTREFPVEVVPARAVTSLDDLQGQRAARPVGPGEILTTDQFAAVGPASGGVVVPEGWEVISVEARPAPGLEGYATTGSRVNLYLTGEAPAEPAPDGITPLSGTLFTQLMLNHTEVLAVTRGTLTGEATGVDGNDPASTGTQVFLLRVRPEDVPRLVYAQQAGTLWFTLVNADDPPGESVRFTFDDLDEGSISAALLQAHAQLQQDAADEDVEDSADASDSE